MPIFTHWEDLAADDVPRPGPPWWYKTGDKHRCKCAAEPVLVEQHQGYSDFVYRRWECPECNHMHVDYLEG